MTLNLAWQSSTTAFLVADSIVTSPGSGTEGRTSFGEYIEVDSGGREQRVERALKVIPLADDTAMVMSGSDIAPAWRFAARARAFLSNGPSLSVSDVLRASRDIEPSVFQRSPFNAIVATSRDGQPTLFAFASAERDPRVVRTDEVVCGGEQFGSLLDGAAHVIANAHDRSVGERPPAPFSEADVEHAMVLAYLQARLMLDPQLERGVGGALTSCLVDDDGRRWPRATSYFLWREFDPTSRNASPEIVLCAGNDGPGPVTVAYRDDLCGVQSGLSGTAKLLSNGFSTDSRAEEIKAGLRDWVRGEAFHCDSDILSIVNLFGRRILIVLRTSDTWGALWRRDEASGALALGLDRELIETIRGRRGSNSPWELTVTNV